MRIIKNMNQIVPALLEPNHESFEKHLRAIENDCDLIQVDVLDNTLFENKNWYNAEAVGKMKTKVEIELHLMVENPIPIIKEWKKHVPTFKRAIVHAEMHRPIGTVVGYIRDVLKLEVGVAVNPETPLSAIENVIHSIDQLTIMSVHPGFQGQEFGDEEHMGSDNAILEKVKHAKAHREDLIIEIDGGVTEELIEPLIKAGVDRIGIGSVLFKSKDPAQKLKELNELLTKISKNV